MTDRGRRILTGAVAWGIVLGSVLINIKNIYTSCQVDSEYQVTMAYRMLRGDAMFSQMWEAHQTSAFFLAFFEWLFLKITGSTTGIMIYANTVGMLCKTVVSLVLYGTFRRYADKRIAFAVLIFSLNTYAKDIVLPDFSNLQVWFILLLVCCMTAYCEENGRRIWLVLGAVCLCLAAVVYPSCVLVWLPCVVLICMYSDRRVQDALILTGICGGSGLAYLLAFMRRQPEKFLMYIYQIWSGDSSHSVNLGGRLALLAGDFKVLAVLLVCIALWAFAVILGVLAYRKAAMRKGKEVAGRKLFYAAICVGLGGYILEYFVSLPMEEAGTKHQFFILYILLEIIAVVCVRFLNEREKKIFWVSHLIGWGSFTATLLLSAMGLFPTLPYLIPNICADLIALGRIWRDETQNEGGGQRLVVLRGSVPAIMICAVMIFRNFFYISGWMVVPGNVYEDSIFSVTWTAKDGPLKGIVNRDGTFVADMMYREWQQYIKPGDKVLVLAYPTLNSTVYLYEDVEICADSCISTPTYSQRLLDYWEENPDKYPNVVVATKSYGKALYLGGDRRVIDWLSEEFNADEMIEGEYWYYYFKR